MMLYCEICKCETRHRWDDYFNEFKCIRLSKEHGYTKRVVIKKKVTDES